MPHFRRLETALLPALLISCVALVGSRVGAQPLDPAPAEPALRVTWQTADPSCSGDDVAARALRSVSPGVVPRPLKAQVDVERDGARWVVRLQTESGEQSGHRILRAESCDEIQRAIALLLAMAMESRLDEAPAEVPPPATSPPAAPVATPPVAVPDPALEEIDRPHPPVAEPRDGGGMHVGAFARLDGKAALGLKPGLGLGAGVAVGVRLGSLDIGVSGALWPDTRARVLDRSGRIRIARQNVGLRACWNAWSAAGWVLAPCVSPELTFFRFASERVEEPVNGHTSPLPSVSAALDLRYELIEGRLSLLVSPAITWERPQPFRITLGGASATDAAESDAQILEIYKTTGLGPRLEIGVDARF